MAAALMHILMGRALGPREAENKGLVHETVNGKVIDRAMEIVRRLSLHTPDSVAPIKRLVRNANETPLAQGACTRTKPLPETVRQRPGARTDAFLRRQKDHVAFALIRHRREREVNRA